MQDAMGKLDTSTHDLFGQIVIQANFFVVVEGFQSDGFDPVLFEIVATSACAILRSMKTRC